MEVTEKKRNEKDKEKEEKDDESEGEEAKGKMSLTKAIMKERSYREDKEWRGSREEEKKYEAGETVRGGEVSRGI